MLLETIFSYKILHISSLRDKHDILIALRILLSPINQNVYAIHEFSTQYSFFTKMKTSTKGHFFIRFLFCNAICHKVFTKICG